MVLAILGFILLIVGFAFSKGESGLAKIATPLRIVGVVVIVYAMPPN